MIQFLYCTKLFATLWAIFGIVAVSGFPQQQQQQPVEENSFAKAISSGSAAKFLCPEDFGFFEDPDQCDKYWQCEEGVSKALLCDDGLVFDINKADGRNDPCDSPFVVNCGQRLLMQDPTFPSDYCPRRHGIFADPDPSVCDKFYTCKEGRHTTTPCSPGLHFHEETGTCVWPAAANRVGCAEKARASVNGFTCPEEEVLNDHAMKVPHPSYPNLDDCQKFYVCLNGKTPQEASCNLGKVFDERTMLCDYPENVPECDGWYKNDPRFADYYQDITPADSKSDPGAVDTVG